MKSMKFQKFKPMRSVLLASGLLIAASTNAFEAPRTSVAPIVDGDPSDDAWHLAEWRNINHVAIGSAPTPEDFNGRYKLVWTHEYLYLLAEITDEILVDANADPLEKYWEDDMLEILIDQDASGGIHLEDFNAFAYHIALDNQIVDIAPKDGKVKPRLFPNHVQARWQRSTTSNGSANNPVYWEARIAVHDDSHTYGDDQSSLITLTAGMTMGFMVAYCDADDGEGRQLFIGDVEIEPVNGDRNLGYINASVFGKLTLVE